VENPGNNLYVTGLSPRITKRELEKHFASEGKVCTSSFPAKFIAIN
jgi:RNA recognition motif-containing protein